MVRLELLSPSCRSRFMCMSVVRPVAEFDFVSCRDCCLLWWSEDRSLGCGGRNRFNPHSPRLVKYSLVVWCPVRWRSIRNSVAGVWYRVQDWVSKERVPHRINDRVQDLRLVNHTVQCSHVEYPYERINLESSLALHFHTLCVFDDLIQHPLYSHTLYTQSRGARPVSVGENLTLLL